MDKHYQALRIFGSHLLKITNLNEGLHYISEHSRKIMRSDRCSLFMFNETQEEFWTLLADGVDKITVPYDTGIVGQTFRERRTIIENEAYGNRNFYVDVDLETGYYTQNLLSAPIFDSRQNVVGVLQLLNKEGGFDKKDLEFITFFAHYISGYIELMGLGETIKPD